VRIGCKLVVETAFGGIDFPENRIKRQVLITRKREDIRIAVRYHFPTGAVNQSREKRAVPRQVIRLPVDGQQLQIKVHRRNDVIALLMNYTPEFPLLHDGLPVLEAPRIIK